MPVQPLPDNPDLERLKGIATTLRDFVRADVPRVDRAGPRAPSAARRPGSRAPATSVVQAGRRPAHRGPHVRVPELAHACASTSSSSTTLTPGTAPAARRRRRSSTTPGGPTSCCDWPASTTATTARIAGEPRPACWPSTRRWPRWSIHTAAATGDVDAADHAAGRRPVGGRPQGGPFGWAPLLYLTYSRLGRRRAPATISRRRPAPARPRRRPRRRLPLGGPALAVHRAHRRVRAAASRARRRTTTSSCWPGCCWRPAPRPTTARRSTTAASATSPATTRVPGAAAGLRARTRRRRSVAAACSATPTSAARTSPPRRCSTRPRPGWPSGSASCSTAASTPNRRGVHPALRRAAPRTRAR